jgi:hypothetical protein
MLAIFPMLMCAVSLTLYKTVVMAVHNRHPDINLVSPIYFCNRGIYNGYSVERMNIGAMMKIGFSFGLDQDEFGGILMYEVQRKRNTVSDHQSSIDTIYAKVIEEALKRMQLLVAWKIKHFEEPKVNIMLVEYDNELVLREDKLAQLYERVNDIPFGHNPSRWLMYDNTALRVTYEVMRKTGLELKITVSQGVRNLDTIRLMHINSER